MLIVGTEPTFPPFEFTEDGKDVGFDIDLLQAVSDKIGYKMEIKNLGFDALIPALKSGQIDLIAAGMDATEERKKQVDFTDVYFSGGYTVVVRKDNTDITGYESLAGKTVGAQVGSRAAFYAKEHGATVKEFDTNSQGWMELEAGTCDAVSIDSAVAMYYLKQGGDKNLKLVGDLIKDRNVAMAVSKEKPELREKVNNALKELKATARTPNYTKNGSAQNLRFNRNGRKANKKTPFREFFLLSVNITYASVFASPAIDRKSSSGTTMKRTGKFAAPGGINRRFISVPALKVSTYCMLYTSSLPMLRAWGGSSTIFRTSSFFP